MKSKKTKSHKERKIANQLKERAQVRMQEREQPNCMIACTNKATKPTKQMCNKAGKKPSKEDDKKESKKTSNQMGAMHAPKEGRK